MKTRQILSLSITLAKAEFKLRNEGSYLGVLWYLFNPILMFLLIFLIFSNILGKSINNYALYLFLGIIMFNFFQQSTIESAKIINSHKRIIKSIKFPKESLIGAVTLKNLFSHLFEIMIFLILLLILNTKIIGIIFYPLIIFIFSFFVYGVSLILSSLSINFPDLENIWLFFSRLLWFATPIFYSSKNQVFLQTINLFNPLYYFITLAREIIIYSTIPELWIILGAITYSLLFILTGTIIFKQLEKTFTEKIR